MATHTFTMIPRNANLSASSGPARANKNPASSTDQLVSPASYTFSLMVLGYGEKYKNINGRSTTKMVDGQEGGIGHRTREGRGVTIVQAEVTMDEELGRLTGTTRKKEGREGADEGEENRS
ncbi:uncharacterized protein LOC112495193 [Cephus cinctus]|uniref:Uncharacterized protein LOC112495193 n=1 Tax=Cephus cinctus TaxID=211228 RepID=A0AAJ7RT03_CEPCN|nr:uncharacterized protein LOC112495193 [Cephus cinctus]